MHLAVFLSVVELGKGFCCALGYDFLPPVGAPCYPNVYLPKHKQLTLKPPYHRVIDKLTYVLRLTKEIQNPHKLQLVVGDVLCLPEFHFDRFVFFLLLVVVFALAGCL